jgi:hypothetical protein
MTIRDDLHFDPADAPRAHPPTAEPADQRYGHEVAPEPSPDASSAAMGYARYHAARAQGFWLAMTTYRRDDLGYDAVAEFLAAFQLAVAWTGLAGMLNEVGLEEFFYDDPDDADNLAGMLAESMRHPHNLGPMLYVLAEGLGLHPDQIKAYGPETNQGELAARAKQLADAEKRGAEQAIMGGQRHVVVWALRRAAEDWRANAVPDDDEDADSIVARQLDARADRIAAGGDR